MADQPNAVELQLSEKEQAEGQERYKQRVEEIKANEIKAMETVLLHHWKRGQFAEELLQQPKTYGCRTVENLAKDLNVHPSSIWYNHRFFLLYPDPKRVKTDLADRGVSSRDVNTLLSLKDPKVRDKLLEKRVAGQIKSDELRDEVKRLNRKAKAAAQKSGKKVDRRGGLRPITVVKSTTSLCADLVAKMDDFKTAYDDWQKMDEGDIKSDTATALREAFKIFGSVGKKVEWIIKYRQKIVEKKKKAGKK
jgi:hypothetical protein